MKTTKKMQGHVYPHMCRIRHIEIGHADSGDDERCPLCRVLDDLEAAEKLVEELEKELHLLKNPQPGYHPNEDYYKEEPNVTERGGA